MPPVVSAGLKVRGLAHSRPIAAKTHSMAPNSCLVKVEPWTGCAPEAAAEGPHPSWATLTLEERDDR